MSEPNTPNQGQKGEVTKSHYERSPDGPMKEPPASYRSGDRVSISVRDANDVLRRVDLIVDSRELDSGGWRYKLKDKDGKLHDGGTLIAESEVKRER